MKLSSLRCFSCSVKKKNKKNKKKKKKTEKQYRHWKDIVARNHVFDLMYADPTTCYLSYPVNSALHCDCKPTSGHLIA